MADCIYELATPVGTVDIYGGGRKISLRVRKNDFDIPYAVFDPSGKKVAELHTDTNYALVVDTDQLTVGTQYQIRFSGGALAYCASDENTEAIAATIDGWSVGIGAYNPNEREEVAQAWAYSQKMGDGKNAAPPPGYDESKMSGYTVRVSDDRTGFAFRLLDQSLGRVEFLVAWIRNDTPDPQVYESALGFWLT